MSIIHGGVTIRDFDMPPAFERREHHEEIGRAVALVFVIEPGWPPLFHPDRSAGFGNQLLRGLIQANQRNTGIARSRVHGQHVFHGRHERAVGLRRDDPLLFQMRLENVFLRVRPIGQWRQGQSQNRDACKRYCLRWRLWDYRCFAVVRFGSNLDCCKAWSGPWPLLVPRMADSTAVATGQA